MREPSNGSRISIWVVAREPHLVASVICSERSYVPCINSMGVPGPPILWLDVGKNFDAGRCNKSSVVVKGAVDIGMGKDLMVWAIWA